MERVDAEITQGTAAAAQLRFALFAGLLVVLLSACDSTGFTVSGKNNVDSQLTASAVIPADNSQGLRPLQAASVLQTFTAVEPETELQPVAEVLPEPEVQQPVPEVQPNQRYSQYQKFSL